jgi:hypothetical protein
VKHHFDEKFVALVIAEHRVSTSWVPVPVGSSRELFEYPPPLVAIDAFMDCHYTQGNRELCLFIPSLRLCIISVLQKSRKSYAWQATILNIIIGLLKLMDYVKLRLRPCCFMIGL